MHRLTVKKCVKSVWVLGEKMWLFGDGGMLSIPPLSTEGLGAELQKSHTLRDACA